MIFRNWVLQNFPFLEDDFDALTDYELFCKMVEYMKKSLDKIKDYQEELNIFNERLDYFQNYFDNLDVQEEINNKLDEMAESGELADIIAQYLQLAGVLAYDTINDLKEAENITNGSICLVLGDITYNDGKTGYYKVREIENTDVIDDFNIVSILAHNNLVAERIPFYGLENVINKTDPQTMNCIELNRIMRTFERNSNSPEHISGEDYAILQGGCYTGNNKMIIARLRRNDLNEVLLQEISLTTGNVIRQSILSLNHANSITFNPIENKLYVTSLLINDNDTNVALQDLYIIDYNSLTLINTITLDLPLNKGVHSISYDIITNKYYIATEDFLNNNSLSFYELNILDYTLTEITINDTSGLTSKTNNNDILVYNNYLYVLKFNPQVLICFNLKDGNLYNVYNIKNYYDGSSVGDLENISLKYDDNNNFIISTYKTECRNGFYNMFQYYETNVFYNINNNTLPKWVDNKKDLFVDINSTSINPNGDNNNKFKHISEALEYAQQLDGNVVLFLSNGVYPYVDYRNNKQYIEIRNQSNTPDITINGMNLEATNMALVNLKILNTLASQNYDLSAVYCDLNLSLLTFLGDFTASIYARRCQIHFYSLTSSKILFYCQTETSLFPHDNTIDFSFTNQKPYCSTPIKLCDELIASSTRIDSSSLPLKSFMLSQKGTIRVYYYAHYNRGYFEFNHDGNEAQRNFSVTINRYIYEIATYFDYSNNKIGFQILTAIQLNNDGTVTNNISSENISILPYFIC